MKEIVRGFLLRIKNEISGNVSIRDGILYSHESPLAWFKSRNIVVMDMSVMHVSKSTNRVANYLADSIGYSGLSLRYTETGRNVVKKPTGTKTSVSLEPETTESIDDLLKELKDNCGISL